MEFHLGNWKTLNLNYYLKSAVFINGETETQTRSMIYSSFSPENQESGGEKHL